MGVRLWSMRTGLCLCDHLTHSAIILSPGVEEVRERESEDKRMKLDQWWCSLFTGVTSSQDSADSDWTGVCVLSHSFSCWYPFSILLKWVSSSLVLPLILPFHSLCLIPSLCSPPRILALLHPLFFSSKHRCGEEHNYRVLWEWNDVPCCILRWKWVAPVGICPEAVCWQSCFPQESVLIFLTISLPANLKTWTYIYGQIKLFVRQLCKCSGGCFTPSLW